MKRHMDMIDCMEGGKGAGGRSFGDYRCVAASILRHTRMIHGQIGVL